MIMDIRVEAWLLDLSKGTMKRDPSVRLYKQLWFLESSKTNAIIIKVKCFFNIYEF